MMLYFLHASPHGATPTYVLPLTDERLGIMILELDWNCFALETAWLETLLELPHGPHPNGVGPYRVHSALRVAMFRVSLSKVGNGDNGISLYTHWVPPW